MCPGCETLGGVKVSMDSTRRTLTERGARRRLRWAEAGAFEQLQLIQRGFTQKPDYARLQLQARVLIHYLDICVSAAADLPKQ
jgi:hypothetical protein